MSACKSLLILFVVGLVAFQPGQALKCYICDPRNNNTCNIENLQPQTCPSQPNVNTTTTQSTTTQSTTTQNTTTTTSRTPSISEIPTSSESTSSGSTTTEGTTTEGTTTESTTTESTTTESTTTESTTTESTTTEGTTTESTTTEGTTTESTTAESTSTESTTTEGTTTESTTTEGTTTESTATESTSTESTTSGETTTSAETTSTTTERPTTTTTEQSIPSESKISAPKLGKNEGGIVNFSSRRQRRSLIDQLLREEASNSTVRCFQEEVTVGDTKKTAYGCTNDLDYCKNNKDCKLCNEDGCNSATSNVVFASMILSMAAIVLFAK
ncbi:hypothetical protein QLX08_003730 [Tetragonisca angustula]|uniref:Uncharacterized protein n=1 Tax=Tetragonisca angustula TaxID=166442 RepID=A0AAW1A511_9HYME